MGLQNNIANKQTNNMRPQSWQQEMNSVQALTGFVHMSATTDSCPHSLFP